MVDLADAFARLLDALDDGPDARAELRRAASAVRACLASTGGIRVHAVWGRGRWGPVAWVRLVDRRAGSPRRGLHLAYVAPAGRAGVALALLHGPDAIRHELGPARARLALRQRVEALRAAVAEVLGPAFATDQGFDLGLDAERAANVDAGLVAYRWYARTAWPPASIWSADLERALAAYRRLLAPRRRYAPGAAERRLVREAPPRAPADAVAALHAYLDARGYRYAPWQVAAYVAALQTKPFLLLSGPTGVGKTRLPLLVAAATGAVSEVLPVRPDWTDSTDVLGWFTPEGRFRPGPLLRFAEAAARAPDRVHVLVLDELNLARPEHYLAEVLSRLELRAPHEATPPLVPAAPSPWGAVGLPPNLQLVGTVNVDESTHGLSARVLDRAFVLELDEIDLALPAASSDAPPGAVWSAAAWRPRALRLAELGPLSSEERAALERVVEVLRAFHQRGRPFGAMVGYRLLDEIGLFVLHARPLAPLWRQADGTPVDPLDVAIASRLLPRLAGSAAALQPLLEAWLAVAAGGRAATRIDAWVAQGRPRAWPDAPLPRTAARLARLWERAEREGFVADPFG